jgi:hypothetical protein
VKSLRNPENQHLVDLEEWDGFGECSCEHWNYRCQPALKAGKRTKACRHIKAARAYVRDKLNEHGSVDGSSRGDDATH